MVTDEHLPEDETPSHAADTPGNASPATAEVSGQFDTTGDPNGPISGHDGGKHDDDAGSDRDPAPERRDDTGPDPAAPQEPREATVPDPAADTPARPSGGEPSGPQDGMPEVPEPIEKQSDTQSDDASQGKRRSTSKRKGADSRRPTDQQVLERMLEKNEMILRLTRETTVLQEKLKAVEDKRLRIVAEFENYRKRTRKEWELLKDQTKAEVFAEMLGVVDDFERALAALGDRDDDFIQGIRLIYNNLRLTLERFGIRKMIAIGQAFDPTYHMAVAQVESKEVESNHVVEVALDGYLMNGTTVIRPANVVIAK